MPLDRYFGGHGAEVMAALKRKHGNDEGERIFYATLNTRTPKGRGHFPRLKRDTR